MSAKEQRAWQEWDRCVSGAEEPELPPAPATTVRHVWYCECGAEFTRNEFGRFWDHLETCPVQREQ